MYVEPEFIVGEVVMALEPLTLGPIRVHAELAAVPSVRIHILGLVVLSPMKYCVARPADVTMVYTVAVRFSGNPPSALACASDSANMDCPSG